jgi:hypothetical protein
MKDFILVSLALTAASAGVSRTDVLSAMKASNSDPEALATNLLQYGEASDTRDAGDCAGLTGLEHCTKCAMPSIQNLVTSLVAVKTEIWTDQKTIVDQAANVCNSANPADRFGGNAKCCSAATAASQYAPSDHGPVGRCGRKFPRQVQPRPRLLLRGEGQGRAQHHDRGLLPLDVDLPHQRGLALHGRADRHL